MIKGSVLALRASGEISELSSGHSRGNRAARTRKSANIVEMPLTNFGRYFSLSEKRGQGIYCGPEGVFIGDVPLLTSDTTGFRKWKVRKVDEINANLSKLYGVPVEFSRKLGSLAAAANALNENDVFYARLTTLHLQIPEPPFQIKPNTLPVAKQLHASGLLKSDWDPQKHPRWRAGSAGGIGGEFSPVGSAIDEAVVSGTEAPTISAQLTLPAPLELPDVIPAPSEIAPAPLAPPDINPFHVPQNPYPGRPECIEEWAQATEYCMKLVRRGWLGRGDYGGMGKTLSQCITSQVSEDCGGNSTGA